MIDFCNYMKTQQAFHKPPSIATTLQCKAPDILLDGGVAHNERCSFEGPWTPNPLIIDNMYFIEPLVGDKEGLLKLPTDKALLEDHVFRPLVEKYATDEDAFFADYVESHMKLSELG
ncbi:hypothetical protein L6452_03934 [Arctium lappa]|uniref:Uncharacterized protein n=1 Tax=Arctium lappa TaxID=4217 RepID=A0ACB9FPI5_ARCLA|nr:hypothetical protein L6452_03934 [Arctium lappa]